MNVKCASFIAHVLKRKPSNMAFSFFYELSKSNINKFLDDANIARRECAQAEFSIMQTRETNGKYGTRILIGKKWTKDKSVLRVQRKLNLKKLATLLLVALKLHLIVVICVTDNVLCYTML